MIEEEENSMNEVDCTNMSMDEVLIGVANEDNVRDTNDNDTVRNNQDDDNDDEEI